MPAKIIVYSAQMCGDCQNLKAYMDDNQIDYVTRDIRETPEYGEELEKETGKLGVPYLKIDGQWKCGYDPGKPFTDDFARGLFSS